MGLNLSDGMNMFLARVSAEHRIPFPLAMTPAEVLGPEAAQLGESVTASIREAVARSISEGAPIARYDRARAQAYIESADGRREYLDA
jgi:antitoxin component of RelBE/YafQ-DinJ toxin-antitoxin module